MKVAFLDRDGVINKEVRYLHKVDNFEYTYRCVDALKTIRDQGFEIIIVTNQAGIARGYYTEDDYNILTEWYLNDLSDKGVHILDVAHCPHHPQGEVSELSIHCECRKPAPGMIVDMLKKYKIDVTTSIMVGDKTSDLMAAKRAGIQRGFLVKSGHPIDFSELNDWVVMRDLYEVSQYLKPLGIGSII